MQTLLRLTTVAYPHGLRNAVRGCPVRSHRPVNAGPAMPRLSKPRWCSLVLVALMLGFAATVNPAMAQPTDAQPIDPAINSADEPVAEPFSMDRATAFLDRAAINWQTDYGCVTCHTNGLYLIAGSYGPKQRSAYEEVRRFSGEYLDRYTVDDEPQRGQRGSIEGMVATTAFRVISDMRTIGKLDPATKRALDYIWAKQDASGAWVDWLKCGWPPFEQDDHYGVTLMALAVGMAGDRLNNDPTAMRGIERLRHYLQEHQPENPHQMGMLLWAGRYMTDLLDKAEKQAGIREILRLQRPDGGWRTADLGAGQWKRDDDALTEMPSDAYATAFAVVALRHGGVGFDDEAILSAIGWLKANQRVSGRWFTRSPIRGRKHFISHAATNLAVMAMARELVPDDAEDSPSR